MNYLKNFENFDNIENNIKYLLLYFNSNTPTNYYILRIAKITNDKIYYNKYYYYYNNDIKNKLKSITVDKNEIHYSYYYLSETTISILYKSQTLKEIIDNLIILNANKYNI